MLTPTYPYIYSKNNVFEIFPNNEKAGVQFGENGVRVGLDAREPQYIGLSVG